ncbi:RNA polymerase II transcription factor B subunit 5 [Lecanosticta acicola]|uniref:General transcription and DNA repair factor IIH subunit TFB5 n=1 Tax=Lecanosticta acicola TaxID=111012 RepID=A0AAI8YRC1_9PEZI|nr:RNA polymerase II transcription factor B subunit 5 [Lecanosticta acicola]
MPRTLVKCDPSIKAIIIKIDAKHGHDIVIEDIDEEYILVKNNRIDDLKGLLKDQLKDTVKEPEEDESESDS